MPKQPSSSVKIGNVSGGIRNSQIAGRDVTGGASAAAPAAGEVTLADLKTMLAEIQTALQQTAARSELLSKISPAAQHSLTGAAACVAAAIDSAQNEKSAETPASIARNLDDASDMIARITRRAENAVEATSTIADEVVPVMERLGELAKKITLAVSWATTLFTN